MVGSIPIIQRSTLDDAYKHLPVAFIDTWEQLLQPANSTAMEALLKGWIEELQPYYLQGSALRKRTLDVSVAMLFSLFLFLSPPYRQQQHLSLMWFTHAMLISSRAETEDCVLDGAGAPQAARVPQAGRPAQPALSGGPQWHCGRRCGRR